MAVIQSVLPVPGIPELQIILAPMLCVVANSSVLVSLRNVAAGEYKNTGINIFVDAVTAYNLPIRQIHC